MAGSALDKIRGEMAFSKFMDIPVYFEYLANGKEVITCLIYIHLRQPR